MNGWRKGLTWALLAFAWVTIGFWWGRSTAPAGAAPAGGDAARAPSAASDAPTLFYFHGDVRCDTCRRMEAWAKEVVGESFSSEVADGRLVFRIVNKDLEENSHYIDDFEMTSNGLVLARRGPDGAWSYEKLEKIWDLSDDRAAFGAFVRDSTRAFLRPAETR